MARWNGRSGRWRGLSKSLPYAIPGQGPSAPGPCLFEVWTEGGLKLAREFRRTPAPGDHLGFGVVVRVEPGRRPDDDQPGRVARIYVRPESESESESGRDEGKGDGGWGPASIAAGG